MEKASSRIELDDRFNKCLKKAIIDTQPLVKGELSEEELDVEQRLQQQLAGEMVESFAKVLLDNEKVSGADVQLKMHLKNIRSKERKQIVRFYSYKPEGLDERGGQIIRDT